MSNVTYSAGNLTITVAGLDTVEQALGDLKRKTPAAAKVAINATARQARKLMVAKAKTRYAVNAAGRRHLKDLVQRKKASNSSLMAELHIAKMRNDLGYFKTSPAVPTHFTGMDFKDGPSVWKAKVLKSSGMKTLPGAGGMSKGFLVKFSSGHVGMVQRRIGSKSSHTRTAKGYKRWTNAKGKIWPRLLFVLNGGRGLFCYAERLTKAPQTAIFEWYCVLKLHRTAEADTGSADIGEEETQCEPIST